MSGQLPALAVLFALIFALNLIPAFAPPTWMALALVGFQYHDTSAVLLAGVGAVASLAIADTSPFSARAPIPCRPPPKASINNYRFNLMAWA